MCGVRGGGGYNAAGCVEKGESWQGERGGGLALTEGPG